jgi:hypothetical protein
VTLLQVLLLRTSLFVLSPCFICLVGPTIDSYYAKLVFKNQFNDASVAHYDHARFVSEVHLMPTATFILTVLLVFLLLPPFHILPSYHTLATPSTSITSIVALPPRIAS